MLTDIPRARQHEARQGCTPSLHAVNWVAPLTVRNYAPQMQAAALSGILPTLLFTAYGFKKHKQ